jgi:hypothetical protein
VIQFVEEGDYEESFATAGQPAVEFDGIDGEAQIQGLEGASGVVVRGTRSAVGSTEERARGNLKHARLTPRNEVVALVLAFDPPLDKLGLVDLQLDRPSTFPEGMGLVVDVDHGDLITTALKGDLQLETGDGDVYVVGAGPGAVNVETGNGDVAVEALGPIAVVSDGMTMISVPDVDDSQVTVETEGQTVVVDIVPQALEVYCYPEGGEVLVDPALLLSAPMNQSEGATWFQTDDEDFEGQRKIVKVWSAGGDISVDALPAP